MLKLGIVPDVIDKAPQQLLQVSYRSGVRAELGNELTPTLVQDEPEVSWEADPASYYTLTLVDPDNTSRAKPDLREWQHWLVVNIPGRDVSKGQVLFEYIGSAPFENTGLHRYVFLVYKQKGKISFQETKVPYTSDKGRAKFSMRRFAAQHGLGEPVAANAYQAQYDDHVPSVYARMS